MSEVIRISDELYKRLEEHANGFDTPSAVIESILDAYEKSGLDKDINISKENSKVSPSNKLDIIYLEGSEENFKEKLLVNKSAYIKIFYNNNNSEIKEWDAKNFDINSKVGGNLRSGYLRDWKKHGIIKAEVAISKSDFV